MQTSASSLSDDQRRTSRNRSATLAWTETSHAFPSTSTEYFPRSSAAADSQSWAWREVSATLAPFWANVSATARPIPRVAPVINAYRFWSIPAHPF